MLAFRQAASRKDISKDQIYEKLAPLPSIVADSLLSRFTEVARGSASCVVYHTFILPSALMLPQLPIHVYDEDEPSHTYLRPMSEARQIRHQLRDASARPQHEASRVSQAHTRSSPSLL